MNDTKKPMEAKDIDAIAKAGDIAGLRLSLASAKTIREWSCGEVTSHRTIEWEINRGKSPSLRYLLKPKKDDPKNGARGLFSEEIFGPDEGWKFTCSCGETTGFVNRDVVCDECGAPVLYRCARRERMGHIELAVPVVHPWFKTTVERLGIKPLDGQVLVRLKTEERDLKLDAANGEDEVPEEDSDTALARKVFMLMGQDDVDIPLFVLRLLGNSDTDPDLRRELLSKTVGYLTAVGKNNEDADKPSLADTILKKYGSYFEWGVGAAAMQKRLRAFGRNARSQGSPALPFDLKSICDDLSAVVNYVSPGDDDGPVADNRSKIPKGLKEKARDRLKYALPLVGHEDDLPNMVLDVIPVLPPDLRPITQAINEGIATHSLTELYKRVIFRNNRVKEAKRIEDELFGFGDAELADKVDWLSEELAKLDSTEDNSEATAVDSIVRETLEVLGINVAQDSDDEESGGQKEGLAERGNEKAIQDELEKHVRGLRRYYKSSRYEKRLLQQSVDELFQKGMNKNGGEKHLKSIEEGLKSKEGLFRKSLQGKRVDFSGRSQIVVDPRLGINQCGLPVEMAFELFKPFVLHTLGEWHKGLDDVVKLERMLNSCLPDVRQRLSESFEDMLLKRLEEDAPGATLGEAWERRLAAEWRRLHNEIDVRLGAEATPIALYKRVPSVTSALGSYGPAFRSDLDELFEEACGRKDDGKQSVWEPVRNSIEEALRALKCNKLGPDDLVVRTALEEVAKSRVVLLNRAPTLHRLSVQAFESVLVEGKAVHLHPLVCKPYNADFDGDTMSVHLPLSKKAQAEARKLMLPTRNLRSPADGSVNLVPSQDMVFGIYFLTAERSGVKGEGREFMDFEDVLRAYDVHWLDMKHEPDGHQVDVQAKVEVHIRMQDANEFDDTGDSRRYLFRVKDVEFVMRAKGRPGAAWQPIDEDVWRERRRDGSRSVELRRRIVDNVYDVTDRPVRISTTVGRIIFYRQCLPADYPFVNYQMSNSDIKALVNDCCDRYSTTDVEPILDAIKRTGFHYATRAGLSVSVWDAVIPADKPQMLEAAQNDIDQIEDNYEMGFVNQDERRREVIRVWQECAEALGAKMLDGFDEDNPIFMMADSGARGSTTQLRQLAGMRGLMKNVKGDINICPVKSNFREGMSEFDFYIAAPGMRKGFVNTSLGTQDAGYLTRKLVYAMQDVIVREEDCGTDEFCTYDVVKPGEASVDTDLIGRCCPNDVVAPDGEVLIPAGGYIESREDLERLLDAGVKKVGLRALLTCRSKYGVCQKCYGWDLSTRRPVNIGTAVGIIAAQSIGEPGTQLTMRTVNSGGVADVDDITQGMPMVERMCSVPKKINSQILGREADLAPESGLLRVYTEGTEYLLQIVDADDTSRVLSNKRVPRSVSFLPEFEEGVKAQRFSPICAGDVITNGFVDLRKLLELSGDREKVMHAFVRSVRDVYALNSIELNAKHLEILASCMLRYVEVTDAGDSQYYKGQYVNRIEFERVARDLEKAHKTPPCSKPLVLGMNSSQRPVESWPARAAFERPREVLSNVALGKCSFARECDLKDPMSATMTGYVCGVFPKMPDACDEEG